MVSLKEILAPFPRTRTLSTRALQIDTAEVIEDDVTYSSLGIPPKTGRYPFLQPPEVEYHLDNGSVPLKSSVEQFALLSPTDVKGLPEEETVPIRCKIAETSSDPRGFNPLVLIHLEPELFLSLLYPAVVAELLDDILEALTSAPYIEISGNILTWISPPEKVIGMNYASRYWEETKIHLPGFRTPKKRSKDHKIVKPILRGQLGNKIVGLSVHKPSFWDMIFVLLQPPLSLDLPENLALPYDLYKYQIRGIEFLLTNQRALLADDMGTGKTVMTLVALKILMRQAKAKKALIICPQSVLHEWKQHLEEWAPELVSTFIRGTREVRKSYWGYPSHVYVTAYSSFRNDVQNGLLPKDYQTQFDVSVVDEAHHIRNPTTAQARAIKTLQPKYRWALTGTPVQNNLEDMVALFEFVYPGLLTSFDAQDRVMAKIAPHFLRRRKQEVMKDLPPKIRQPLELELDDDQQKAYQQVERESRLEITALGNKVTKTHIFAKLNLLKQICNFAPGKSTSPKLEDLIDRIEEIVESDQKVIVFSQYLSEGIDKIEKGIRPFSSAKIVGGQSDTVRKMEIDRFKLDKDTHILLASVRSGGEGLNLAEASYVVHFDHWWNPAVMWQAEDRAHRGGQKNTVNIYSYWMLDTIDMRIREILDRKGILITNVVDGLAEEYIEGLFSMDDLLEIIGVPRTAPVEPKIDYRSWQNLSLEQIRQKLFEIKPYEFENLIQQLMHYLGFPNVRVTKRSGDGGVDILSTRNTGKGVERIAAQCKRYKNPVGVKIAREFLGAIKDDPSIIKGYLITTSDFTAGCIAYCNRNGIEMISGLQVAEYVRMFSPEVYNSG